LTTGVAMPRNYIRFLLSRPRNVEPELRAQIEKVLATGLRVTHLNSHQHLHLWPWIWRIVSRLATEYRIGFVRVVNDRGGKRRRLAMGMLNRVAAAAPGRRTIGIAEAGHLTADRIIELLDFVDDTTELVTHPGVGVSGYAHWRYDWETETRALRDPRVREAIASRGIRLVAPSNI
jgi:predicted glycoside hydrolase/deacetylase ChbG (UPF0249 family)